MNQLSAKAAQLASRLFRELLGHGDLRTLSAVLSPHALWIGSGCPVPQPAETLLQLFAELPVYLVSEEQTHSSLLEDRILLFEYSCIARKKESDGEPISLTASLLLRQQEDSLLLSHIHLTFSPLESPIMSDEGMLQNLPDSWHQPEKMAENAQRRDLEELLALEQRELEVSSEVQKILREELEQSNRQMQIVMSAIQGGLKISRFDEEYSYLYVSDEVFALFGYSREEFYAISGGTAMGAVYAEDRPRIRNERRHIFQNDTPDYTLKYRIACKDGGLKWIIDTGKRVRDDQGNWIINSIYLDVTDIEMANQKIAEQREVLDSIYNSVMCGILRYRIEDGQLSYLNMNYKAVEMLGYQSVQDCYEQGVKEFYNRIYAEDRDEVVYGLAQLQKVGDIFRGEYRIQPPNKDIRWIYGTSEYLCNVDGKYVIQRIMIDMTEKKQLELELEEERQRFRIAAECTPVMIFEYDIASDVFTSYGTLDESGEKHDLDLQINYYLAKTMKTQVAFPYQEAFRQLLLGHDSSTLELQMASYYQSPHLVWASVSVTPTSDGQGAPSRVIGKISNIQSEKEKEERIQEMKARDGLTGLYNKGFGIQLVQDYMLQRDPDEVCGMMLLDMDDFQRINEAEGRVFADAILQEVADILRAEIGPQDFAVRLGGDEFMLFVKNCPKSRATILGPRIAEQIRALLCYSDKEIHISASIGMCVTSVADEYAELYRCAESTLKYTKTHKKGQASCYLDTSNEVGVMLTQLYTDTYEVNEVDRQTIGSSENMISFVLDLLGKSNNLNDAVYLLLTRLGKTYHLARVSLLEIDNEYLTWHYSFQWARKQSDLQVGQKFYTTQGELADISRSYNEEGLSERAATDHISTLQSRLCAAILDHGVYVGALCFEAFEPGHFWPEEQRRLLKELAKLLPSFVMKARADVISQAKTDFLSRMSHEIRTPMNAISGMTMIAKAVLDDRERAMECLNKIDSANQYLLNLINDVLDMSRIESGKLDLNLQAADLSKLLQNLESLHSSQAGTKGLQLSFQNRYGENHPVLADELRLNQVLVNIIGNAIKFTPEGGRVLVSLRVLQKKPEGVQLCFSVSDTGIGISPSAMERIFNAFEQAEKGTSAQYGGTGLGLSISSRLVQMMGGSLEVKSELGRGSEFSFTLTMPYATDLPVLAEQAPAPVTQEDFKGKRLLLAEDNEINREIAAEILTMYGFLVECAVDGQEAVSLFSSHDPGYYDGVLMDIRMPVMDGLEATRKIRTAGKRDSRTIPIIAMTANAFDEDSKKSIESGMNGHLTKPIQMDQFLYTLHKCL